MNELNNLTLEIKKIYSTILYQQHFYLTSNENQYNLMTLK